MRYRVKVLQSVQEATSRAIDDVTDARSGGS